jgi:hypothetical protein
MQTAMLVFTIATIGGIAWIVGELAGAAWEDWKRRR